MEKTANSYSRASKKGEGEEFKGEEKFP